MTINWVGWVLSAFVLLLLFAMGAVLLDPVRLLITGKRAQGTVVDMARDSDLTAPMVEFMTAQGKLVRVAGRDYDRSKSIHIGDRITVMYDLAEPQNAHLLLLREFYMAGIILGFVIFTLLLWISGQLIDPTAGLDDPLHIISSIISRFHLSPWWFPICFMVPLAIFSTGLGTYITVKDVVDLKMNGIRVPGYVVGSISMNAELSDGSRTDNAKFPMIKYVDTSGTAYTIRGSLARPLSRLKVDDEVEIIYPALHPGKGVMNKWYELYIVPFFWTFMFIAFITMFRLILKGTISHL